MADQTRAQASSESGSGPHQGQPVLTAGEPPERANAAMIMVHGRGAGAQDILSLAPHIEMEGFAFHAPQARGNTWYPHRFLEPIERNEPYLSSALAVLADLVARLGEAGIPPERIVLLGFSQGACLATEFAARNARRWGAVAGLSGGLIGPDGTPRDYPGSLAGTPVFLGCDDRDGHIPKERVEETAAVFTRLGADVTMRLYQDMGHTITEDELTAVRTMMRRLVDQAEDLAPA
jgi:predicted esterase